MGGFIEWHMVVICIWFSLFVTSQFDVIFMFPNQRFGEVCWHILRICIFVYTHSPYFMRHCTEYKLSALQVRISEENILNAAIQQCTTAKISGCTLKQGSKTHSSLRQSNLQLQNAVMCPSHFCRVRVTSPSSQSHLNFFRVESESRLGRVRVESLLVIGLQARVNVESHEISRIFYEIFYAMKWLPISLKIVPNMLWNGAR